MFRESCRKFFEDEVKPFHGQYSIALGTQYTLAQ